jgi:phage baseplate assembly protein V
MKALDELKRRVMMGVGRAVLAAIDDGQKAQSLQIELLDGETLDDVERFQNYGFSSVPFAGAEGVSVGVGGLRSHSIIIAVEDRRYRLTGGAPGEVVMYDDQGQKVHLQRAQILITSPHKVVINSAAEVDLTAPKVVVTSPDVELGAPGGAAVARLGDQVTVGGVVGTITGPCATKVSAA